MALGLTSNFGNELNLGFRSVELAIIDFVSSDVVSDTQWIATAFARQVLRQASWDAKVANLNLQIICYKNIVWFNIPMHNVMLVQELKS